MLFISMVSDYVFENLIGDDTKDDREFKTGIRVDQLFTNKNRIS